MRLYHRYFLPILARVASKGGPGEKQPWWKMWLSLKYGRADKKPRRFDDWENKFVGRFFLFDKTEKYDNIYR